MFSEFQQFRNKLASFESFRVGWKFADDPKMFWTIFEPLAKHLDKFARHLFSTPANSVPSERAFSIQNIIHTKIRNALKSKKVDKLTYIYMNARVLEAMEILALESIEALSLGVDYIYELSDEQEVILEALAMEEFEEFEEEDEEEEEEEEEVDEDEDERM